MHTVSLCKNKKTKSALKDLNLTFYYKPTMDTRREMARGASRAFLTCSSGGLLIRTTSGRQVGTIDQRTATFNPDGSVWVHPPDLVAKLFKPMLIPAESVIRIDEEVYERLTSDKAFDYLEQASHGTGLFVQRLVDAAKVN